MGFRFWRRIRIAPGVTLNLSKAGGSLSFGARGAHFTVGSRGKRVTAGIPGTGLFYTSALPGGKHGSDGRTTSGHAGNPAVHTAAEDKLTPGFFKRLMTPDDEEAFVDGCRELALGNEDKAITQLRQAIHLADGAWLAGFLALKKNRLDQAEEFLHMALEKSNRLGYYFSKYGISATLSLPVTDEAEAFVGADVRGIWLGLVEIYQRKERWPDAIHCLERLQLLNPDDVVVKLSLAELLMQSHPGDTSVCKKVAKLAQHIENDTPIHAALLLYKARALRSMGLADAARDVLTRTLRRRKGRSSELLHALRYERALSYEQLGRHRQARSDLERIYAEDADYEDVSSRLNLDYS